MKILLQCDDLREGGRENVNTLTMLLRLFLGSPWLYTLRTGPHFVFRDIIVKILEKVDDFVVPLERICTKRLKKY